MATITVTINGSGGTYATPALAASAFVAGTIPGATTGDDIVFNITQNAAFDSRFRITGNTGGYRSWTLTADPSVRHNGTYGSGARLAISTVVQNAVEHTVAALTGTVEWLEITASGSGRIAAGVEISATFNASHSVTVRQCLIHDNGSHATSPFRTCAVGNPGNANCTMSGNVTVHNNLIAGWKSGSTVNAVGIANTAAGATFNVLNNTVDDIDVTGGTAGIARGIAVANSATHAARNNVVTRIGVNTTGGTRTCYSGNGGSTVGQNNASDDSTAFGTSALTSIVRGDNFNAPDSGDYRPLNDSAPIFGSGTDLGTTPTNVQFDLRGRDRDTSGDSWSRGGYQLSAGGVVANGVTLTTPMAYTIRQRSGGAANHTVSGTYTGTPTNIEVQIDGGGWTTLQAGPTGGTFSGSVSIPTGTNTVAVRFSNDTGVTASVANILVGDVFFVIGQSNADGRLTNARTFTASGGNTASVFDPDDTAWRLLADPTNRTASGGTPWPLLATTILANNSVPVGFVCAAEGGTAMNQWWSGTAQAKYTAAKSRATAAGITAFAAALWDQGESDAIDDVTQATYNANLDGLAADVLSSYGCPLICAATGTTTGVDAASDLDAIRLAQIEAWENNTTAVKPGPMGYDRANLHWETNTEGATIAGRWYQAVAAVLYGGSNARGPRIQSATLNEARTQIAVVFDKTLKTGLTLSTAPWAVSDNGTPATVSGVAYTGSTVTLTLSAALTGPADSCTLTYASGNTGAGVVVPLGNAADQPAEPIYTAAVNEYDPTPPPPTTTPLVSRIRGGATRSIVFSKANRM